MALGIWVILSMVPSYAEAFGRTKTDVAAVYFLGKKTFRREDVLLNLNLIALVSAGLIISLILWQFEPIYDWLFKNDTGNHKTELLVLLIQIPLNFLYLNYTYFHIAHENIHAYNRMVVTNALSNSFTVICLLTLTTIGLWSVILGGLIGSSLALLYGWFAIDRNGWVKGLPSKQVSIALFRYGIHFYLGGILGQLQQTGINLLAVAYLLPAQMAFLAQAQGVGLLLDKVVRPINTLLFPRVSSSNQNETVEITCKAFRVTTILMFASGLVLMMFAEPLIVLLYGPEFQPTALVVRYLIPGLVIVGVGGTLVNYFSGIGQASIIPKIQALPLILQLILAWVFLQWWDLTGAAMAISIGGVLYGLMLMFIFKKLSGVSYSLLIPSLADIMYIKSFAKNLINKLLNYS